MSFLYRLPQDIASAVLHQYVESTELDMAFWLAMLQRIETAAAILVQSTHFAVNQRVRWRLVTGPGDLREPIGKPVPVT